MVRKLSEEYGVRGLEINIYKTKYISVGAAPPNLQLDDSYTILFTYLGVTTEIQKRVVQVIKTVICLN